MDMILDTSSVLLLPTCVTVSNMDIIKPILKLKTCGSQLMIAR